MPTSLTADPQLHSAVEACAAALWKIVGYELEPSLQRRLQDLGERKEFLSADEHDELMALVDFTRKRSLEALEAELALQRLRAFFPDAVPVP